MMHESRHFEFYSCLGKFRRPPVEGVLKNSDSGGANVSLFFLVVVIQYLVTKCLYFIEIKNRRHIYEENFTYF
jgi:hypothetical protein